MKMTRKVADLIADYQRIYLDHLQAESEAEAAAKAATYAEITAKAARIAEIDLSNKEQVAHSALLGYIEDRA